ncbi:zinc-regulated transporter 1 [Trichomonascus vanleenenianus]|uniref:high-affinity Zn(2+) transporter ZRT1 n=1 Tax=Trichomonascus vanleenenianus TaxID=2268995 RepID=UPI003ECB3E2B
MTITYDPANITLADPSVDDSIKICILQGVIGADNEYNGSLGARISSIFVIFFLSTAATLFPVIAKRTKRLRIPLYVYLFARHFGSGVIVATAFIHLLDPAYSEIGGTSCVGMTGHWADYSWCPAIILATVFFVFFLDLGSAVYVERKYGITHDHDGEVEDIITRPGGGQPHQHGDIEELARHNSGEDMCKVDSHQMREVKSHDTSLDSLNEERGFQKDIAAFLILEFGVIFHSVMIGINLGSTGEEFKDLYVVLIFHQSFEGLGIGARLSSIPFPQGKRWWPYALCLAYGLTTPISIAAGLGVRTTYLGNAYHTNVVSGVLDAISAGILIYTGLVELLARDYLMDKRPKELKRLFFMLGCLLLGAGLMALLGKWA